MIRVFLRMYSNFCISNVLMILIFFHQTLVLLGCLWMSWSVGIVGVVFN